MKKNISPGHEVLSLKNESIPLLKNRFLDRFTRVKWFVPILVFTPIIAYFTFVGITSLPFSQFVISAVTGILIWTLTEYVFHRFIFHTVPKSKTGRKFHFILHGIHHAYPNDALRLVMPPAISVPLSALFCVVFQALFGSLYSAIFAGFMAAYLVYDMLHYAVHHVHSSHWQWFNAKKQRHMKHHYLQSESEFAVSSPFWDRLFNTISSDNNAKKQ
ncbi:MAG: sterol desaturase family protein [Bacteroidota bacterium]